MKTYYKMFGLMLVPGFLLGMQTPPRNLLMPEPTVQTTPSTPVTQRIATPLTQSPRTPRTPARRTSLTPPASPVRVSPRLQAQQRTLYWQGIFRQVINLLEHDYNGEGYEQAENLVRQACVQVQFLYNGAAYQECNIFHILALINSADLCYETGAQLSDQMQRALVNPKDCVVRCSVAYGTPLHIAIKNNNVAMMNWLIGFGAIVDQECNLRRHYDSCCRMPALHYAIQCSSVEAVEVLLGRGADVNSLTNDDNRDSALHIAFRLTPDWRARRILSLLTDYDPDMSLRNACGNTPLHVAAMRRNMLHADNLAMFLQFMHNTDLHLVMRNNGDENYPPSTSLEVASDRGNVDVLRLLQEARRWPIHDYLRYQHLLNRREHRHNPY